MRSVSYRVQSTKPFKQKFCTENSSKQTNKQILQCNTQIRNSSYKILQTMILWFRCSTILWSLEDSRVSGCSIATAAESRTWSSIRYGLYLVQKAYIVRIAYIIHFTKVTHLRTYHSFFFFWGQFWALPTKALKDIVFRFIIGYSSLRAFYRPPPR